ncbi:hypothetical protein [Streptomyces sp. GC420]|uniref:hypothetical protein n=1 Tax=Streptomyces sp. GC420 TaxID=2697568 RepID=UPI0014150A24|nr:hypothetical protein [Streptomyces sp. GC420]NBM19398.1 hypothetical protein [Streptomyces sp. GC420]
MAVHTADRGAHDGGCACGGCPHGAREGHRRAVAAFLARRDELAAGKGLPAAVAHSAGASRQWVSDELTQSARLVVERAREAGVARRERGWRTALLVVWGGTALLFLLQLLTALGSAGWTTARTAGLLAALGVAVPLSAAAYAHRERGGVLAPVVGEDNRLSTSRTVAALWVLLAGYAVLVVGAGLAAAGTPGERDRLLGGLAAERSAGLLTVLAVSCAVTVAARGIVSLRARQGRLQKVRAERPRAADLLTDDSGRGSFADTQYVLVGGVVLAFACVRLARRPAELPDLPWGLALLMVVSAATYLAGKFTEGGRPVVLSVVRAREAGDLDAPIRTGDDIEIRGTGFVPPGAETPELLGRLAVRIGAVHVHVPLVPVTGGFTNPSDTVLTVPVPVEVEPGTVDVQVVTAVGTESNRCRIEITD